MVIKHDTLKHAISYKSIYTENYKVKGKTSYFHCGHCNVRCSTESHTCKTNLDLLQPYLL